MFYLVIVGAHKNTKLVLHTTKGRFFTSLQKPRKHGMTNVFDTPLIANV